MSDHRCPAVLRGRIYMRPRSKLNVLRTNIILLHAMSKIAGRDDNSSRPASRAKITAGGARIPSHSDSGF